MSHHESFGWASQQACDRNSCTPTLPATTQIPQLASRFTQIPQGISAKVVGEVLAVRFSMLATKRFVYVLVSESNPQRHYVGVTSDVPTRLAVHNSGGSRHTASDRPWRLIVALEFAAEQSALNFERYLKSGSGRAFAKRHFV